MRVPLAFALLLFLAASLRGQTPYFPDRAFCETDERGPCEKWYAKHLRAMHEPSLWMSSKDTSTESYRFLWLRTFHHPVSARLSISKDGYAQLVVKILGGHGGYEPGHLVHNRTIKVSKESVSNFVELLQKADFWNAPTVEKIDNVVGLDGAQWILEARKEGQYHIVDRWSPDSGPFRSAALFLAIDLGGLNPRYRDVY